MSGKATPMWWRGWRAELAKTASEPIQRRILAVGVLGMWVIAGARMVLAHDGGSVPEAPSPCAGLGLSTIIVGLLSAHSVSEDFIHGDVNLSVVNAGGRLGYFRDKMSAIGMLALAVTALGMLGTCVLGVPSRFGTEWWAVAAGVLLTNVVVSWLGAGMGFLIRQGAGAVVAVLALLCSPVLLADQVLVGTPVAPVTRDVLSLVPLFVRLTGSRSAPLTGSVALLLLAGGTVLVALWRFRNRPLPR